MASFNPGAAVWTPPKAGAPPECVKRSLSVSGTWRLSYPDPEGAENQIEGATNQGAAKTANTVVKLMKSANEKKGPSAMSRMEKGQAKEAGLPKDRPPQLMVAIEVFKHCCLRCPPRLHEAGKLIVESMGSQLYTIATFYEDAAVFVLSRMWFDTIAGCAPHPHTPHSPSLLSGAGPNRAGIPLRPPACFPEPFQGGVTHSVLSQIFSRSTRSPTVEPSSRPPASRRRPHNRSSSSPSACCSSLRS